MGHLISNRRKNLTVWTRFSEQNVEENSSPSEEIKHFSNDISQKSYGSSDFESTKSGDAGRSSRFVGQGVEGGGGLG